MHCLHSGQRDPVKQIMYPSGLVAAATLITKD
jgi:hypothetical protein